MPCNLAAYAAPLACRTAANRAGSRNLPAQRLDIQGFDSSAGGVPSPLVDGRPQCSLLLSTSPSSRIHFVRTYLAARSVSRYALKNLYSVTFPKGQWPPVKAFWSLTLYNEHHFLNPNQLKRYSLGTKNKTLKFSADGSLTLYAGATSPGKEKESNWPPAPDGACSLYVRAYWAEQVVLDGIWVPPQVEKVK